MRHILCVQLKNWPINRVKRKRPALRDRPIAIVETVRGKQMIIACCRRAWQNGIRPQMTLSEAKAFCASLIDVAYEPDRDRKALEALARFLIRFTPVVSLEGEDAFLLDVTGCDRLFGGFPTLVEQMFHSLLRFRIAASAVLAPTAAAALAIASCERIGWRIVGRDELHNVLLPLPVDTLRVDPLITANLRRVGINSIGQLCGLPRDALPSRFGESLLHRLDVALGNCSEAFAPVPDSDAIIASVEFDDPIDSLELVWEIVRELVDRVCDDLARRTCGARKLRLRFQQAYSETIERTVSLARPSRRPKNLLTLIQCSLESLRAASGFIRIDLDVPVFEPITTEQITFDSRHEHDAQIELCGLIERLQARLGADAVLRPRWVESHVPELACIYEPATSDRPDIAAMAVHVAKPLSARPLFLYAMPIEIGVIVSPSEDREGHPIAFTHRGQVHRLRFAVGPERISGPWWDGRDKTRDYFEVEDEIGLRFWLFRVLETWKWYLHGRFE